MQNLSNQIIPIEVFRNEILAAYRLAAWQKTLNVEVILISEFMNSEVRINSTYSALKRFLFLNSQR